jgi:hypothetical protein
MLNQSFLVNYGFIFVPVALGVLLPALFLPWVLINLLGLTPFSLIDIVASTIWKDDSRSSDQNSRFDLQDFVSSYQDTSNAIVASMISYIASIIFMIAAIPIKRYRSTIALSAGILAIVSSFLWFYSVDSLKNDFAEQAAITGGIIGEEFKGQERSLADIIIGLGLGPYVALVGGAIGTLAFFSQKAAIVKKRH